MSLEPTCDYCEVSVKPRCRTILDAENCYLYERDKNMSNTPGQANKPSTSLQLAELASRQARSVIAVIDALATRGAFKGEELSTIGMLREQSAQITNLAEIVQTTEVAKNSK